MKIIKQTVPLMLITVAYSEEYGEGDDAWEVDKRNILYWAVDDDMRFQPIVMGDMGPRMLEESEIHTANDAWACESFVTDKDDWQYEKRLKLVKSMVRATYNTRNKYEKELVVDN